MLRGKILASGGRFTFKVEHDTDALTGAPLAQHFEGGVKSHWWEMMCKRCDWFCSLPMEGQAEPDVIADRMEQLREHARSHAN